MRYIRVKWIHHFTDEPVEIYSEIDEAGWETRKVEIFADGSASFACPTTATGDSVLSQVPIQSLEEINTDPQFQGTNISGQDFERIWTNYARLDASPC